MKAVTVNGKTVEIQVQKSHERCSVDASVTAEVMLEQAKWIGCIDGAASDEFIRFVVEYRHDGTDPELLSAPVDAVWLLDDHPSSAESTGYALRVGSPVYLKR